MEAGFEHFDHTADMGVRVWAPTMVGLIEPAAEGLYAAIGDLASTGPTQPFSFDRRGEPAMMLRDFLNELLILFERDRRRLLGYERIEFDDAHLAVTASSALLDEEQSALYREVKAITYHELSVRRIDGGFEAVFIVDI